MKQIEHKVYILEQEDGSDVNMSDFTSLNIAVNDKVTELTVEDVFKKFEGYEKNKLVGWSILQFFKFEDGYLIDEDRNKISFYSKQLEMNLYVKKVRNAIIMLGDIEIKDAYIRDVKKLINLSKGRVTENKQQQIDEVKAEISQSDLTPEVLTEPVTVEPAQQTEEPTSSEPVQTEETSTEPAPEPVAVEPAPVEIVATEPVSEPVAVEPAPEPAPEPVAVEPAPVESITEPVAVEPAPVEPVQEPAEEPTPEPKSEPTPEPEPDQDSYEFLKRYYINDEGYTEYVKGDYRLLYKNEDMPYLIKITEDTFEQINGDVITDNEKKFVYEIEENGKSKKITFDKASEPVAEQ